METNIFFLLQDIQWNLFTHKARVEHEQNFRVAPPPQRGELQQKSTTFYLTIYWLVFLISCD